MDDKNKDNLTDQDVKESIEEYNQKPEDRFTTQDISEIERLADSSHMSDFDNYHSFGSEKDLEEPDTGEEDDGLDYETDDTDFDLSVKSEEDSTEPVDWIEEEISEPEDSATTEELDLDNEDQNQTEPLESQEETEDFSTDESGNVEPIQTDEINKELEKENREETKDLSGLTATSYYKNREEELPETVGTKKEEEKEPEKPKNENKSSKGSFFGKAKKGKGLPKRNQKPPWVKSVAIFFGVLLALGIIGAGGVYLLYTANFTDISDTKYTPKENTIIYTSDNVEIARIYSENRKYISIDQVPQDLKNALVATEDSRFYTHNGVDFIGVTRALLSNLLEGNSTGQGASTLTQQLSRLLYLPDISTEDSFMDSLNRKFKEISIAFQMEDKYTKDQILEMYLNEYFFGSASYGIEAASETYFGKNVSELNLAESAMLAGLPQAPSIYAPNVNFDAAKERQKQVLDRMVAAGYIDQAQADEAYNTPLNIVPWSEEMLNNQVTPGYGDFVGQVISEYANAVAPSIMKERGLTEDEAISYARQAVSSGGYKFYTTINYNYQQIAMSTMEGNLAAYGYSQADGYTGALVSVDQDGAVRSYYGGNEAYSDIDMASSPRQPGSNIKPLYYAMGLETGAFSPNTILNDSPINIGGYSPQNYDHTYSGAISFTQSLVQSRNVTSVQVFDALGTQNAIDWIKRFGFDTISDDDYNLSVALGGLTYGVRPYQMAAAFNTFNDGGVYHQAYFIDRVTTSQGDPVIDRAGFNLISEQIMSPQTASAMWGIMQQVVTAGTGTNAQCGLPTAGKTGTTDNGENLWFTGMTGDLTTSIWLGHLDYYVVGGGSDVPAALYGSYMRSLINNGYV